MNKKTNVRIQYFNEYGADRASMQIFEYKYKNSMTISVIGYIKFTKFKGSEEYTSPRAEVISQEPNKFFKMYKLFKFIEDNTNYRASMKEICNLINMEEYVIFDHEFIKLSDNGKLMFSIYTNEELYTKFVASTEIQGIKEGEKIALKHNLDNYTFDFKTITI